MFNVIPRAGLHLAALGEQCRAVEGRRAVHLRGWRSTIGNLIEIVWLKKPYRGSQFTGTCVNN